MIMKILVCMAILFSASVSAQLPQSGIEPRHNELIQTYCVTCHNESLRTANLLLDQVILEPVAEKAATWEKVVRRLRARSMPPQGMPRPNNAEYEYVIRHLEAELDGAAAANPNPGRSEPHRLNRAEYANAVRDILDLEIDIDSLLPSDAATGHGFDNIASALTLSPMLMDRYMSAAKAVSRLAMGDPEFPSAIETYIIPRNLNQQNRMSDDLPFASRGGTVVDHYFPVDGEYVFRVQLQSIETGLHAGKIEGFARPNRLEVRLDGAMLQQFSVGGDRQYAVNLEFRTSVKAGMHSVGVSFLRDRFKTEVISKKARDDSYGSSSVSLMEVEGPYNITGVGDTPSRRKIFSCQPDRKSEEMSCAEEILARLARYSYRRPPHERDLRSLLALYQSGSTKGGFEAGIGWAIQGILISPKFLFRVEYDPANAAPNGVFPITDLELASRLSFFLWSSIPDGTLLDLATSHKLSESGILAQQVQRMIADPRSKAMVENFALQWLHVRNLDLLSPPDSKVFPNYSEKLKTAFKKEIEFLFDYVISEDRSILDFLNADYSFLNDQLARHYGIPDVHGSHFRRVSLTDEIRWGLLGKSSILTVTSYATRTSPTLRGKWILENILGTPPPPPPPDVPSLKENEETKNLSMRERMEMHRTNPVCASCHSLMDPLGLALENFDAIGTYREVSSNNTPIDASGRLPNGTEFDGPAQLREALWQGRYQFARTFVERLLTYALGRRLEYYDMHAVRRILAEAEKQDYRWSSVVMQVVASEPFRMRRSNEP